MTLDTKGLNSEPAEAIDPIKVEVIQNALMSFIKELRHTILRTSFGPNLRERGDFSCALQARNGELVAIFQDNPPHIVPTVYAVRSVQQRFGDDIHPGDIIMINDPYVLGGHMNDVTHMYPIFDSGKLILWVVIRLHYTDIGGMAPGSITPNSTDVFQEGFRIPAAKAYQAGKPNDAFIDTLFSNVRVPEERKADFMALVASFWSGEKRLRDILDIHGADVVMRCTELVRDRAERRMRSIIRELPDGEYAYEVNLDSDGLVGHWVPIRVSARIEGDSMTIDFSESAPEVAGPLNGSEASAACAAFVAVKSLFDPTSTINGGSFRPIRVLTRAGTIFQALPPAPTCCSQDLMFRGTSAVIAALAPAVPGYAIADHCCTAHHYISGIDPDSGKRFIMYDSPIGGTGAVQGQDGNDVLAGFERGDHGRIMPIEVHEKEFPFLAKFSELRPDSGGAGQQRGGLGIRRGWELVRGSATVTDLAEPSFTPTHGLLGAHGGAPNTTLIKRGESTLAPALRTGKIVRFPVQQGDLLQILKWGGGGYGDPLERQSQTVLEDVEQEFVSVRAARELYGVVIKDGALDERATSELRKQLRAARIFLSVTPVAVDTLHDHARLWHLSPQDAKSLEVGDGDIVECIAPGTASLRGIVRVDPQCKTGQLPTGPFALLVFRVRGGTRVWIRKMVDPMTAELGKVWDRASVSAEVSRA